MADKTPSMRAFFRESLPFIEQPEQVTTPAPPGWPEGMEFTWQKLTQDAMEGLYKAHTRKKWAKGPDGKPIYDRNGAPIQIEERDSFAYLRNAIAEALVYPDLHDRDAQLSWGVVNASDLAGKLFNRASDWRYMTETFNRIHNISDEDAAAPQETYEQLKK